VVSQMKFIYGKGQNVEGVELDKVHDQLISILKAHPSLIGALSPSEIAAEWINDLLFLGGHADLDEIKPVDIGETEFHDDSGSFDEDEEE